MTKDMTSKVYTKQIGGSHYKKMKIQPSKFVIENKLLFPEGNVIKYICRHQYKGGKEDLLKAMHFIEMIIERDYTKPYDATEDVEKIQKHTDWITGYKEWKKNK